VFERIQMPAIATFEGSRYVLLSLSDVRSETRLLIAPLADVLAHKAHWLAVAEFADEVTDAEIDGESLYLLANRERPRGRVLKTSVAAPAIAGAAEVVPQSEWVIEHLSLARDGLYLPMLDGGLARLKRLGRDGRIPGQSSTPVHKQVEGKTSGECPGNRLEKGAYFPCPVRSRHDAFAPSTRANAMHPTHRGCSIYFLRTRVRGVANPSDRPITRLAVASLGGVDRLSNAMPRFQGGRA